MKVPHTITLKQKFAIGNRLKEILIERPDGLVEYIAGWGDQRVADEFSIPKHLVLSVRKRAFGKLFTIGAAPDGSNPSANLKKRVRALEDWAAKMDPDFKAGLIRL